MAKQSAARIALTTTAIAAVAALLLATPSELAAPAPLPSVVATVELVAVVTPLIHRQAAAAAAADSAGPLTPEEAKKLLNRADVVRAIETQTGMTRAQITQAANDPAVIQAVVNASSTGPAAGRSMIGYGVNGNSSSPNGGAGGWLVGTGGNGYNSRTANVTGGNGGAAGVFGRGGNGGSGGLGARGGDGGSADLYGNGGNGGNGGVGGTVQTGDATANAGTENVVNSNDVKVEGCGCDAGVNYDEDRVDDISVNNKVRLEVENNGFVLNSTSAYAKTGWNRAEGSEGGDGARAGSGGDGDKADADADSGHNGGDASADADGGNGGKGGNGGMGGEGSEGGLVVTGEARSNSGTINVVNANLIRVIR